MCMYICLNNIGDLSSRLQCIYHSLILIDIVCLREQEVHVGYKPPVEVYLIYCFGSTLMQAFRHLFVLHGLQTKVGWYLK